MRMPKRQDLPAPKKSSLIQQWPLRLERPISHPTAGGGKSCLLSGTLAHSPTSWPSNSQFTRNDSPIASRYCRNKHYKKNTNWTWPLTLDLSPTTKDNDFELINHRKLVHFNALFGRRDCSMIVQEDISSLQSSRMKSKNKVEIHKV